MTTPSSAVCPACGSSGSGNFCSDCGAGLRQHVCGHCQSGVSAQARFCHRCGRPTGAAPTHSSGSDRRAWTVAAVLCVVLVGGIAYKVSSAAGPAVPDMANAGSSAGAAGPASDISGMTPRERFDRLFNRIMQAAERADSAEVGRFTPMALGAYQQLDAADADARYHAAVLNIQVGNLAQASALADTILAEAPGHLFGYVVRGEVAALSGNPRLRAQAERDFLAHYEPELAAKRVEYLEHQPALDEFKAEAERAEKAERAD